MAGGGVNTEQFEAYFRRADVDQDGKISGAEAVAFLQGSNLPRQVLAQIWMHADQSHTGFLSRPEFYNALKLVTVAQSKRELTPDIVKAAIYGSASGKIPAPKINLAATPAPQSSSVRAPPSPQMGVSAPASSNNLGIRGLTPPSTSVNQQFGQVQPMVGINQQLGQVPSSAGMNQQFRQATPSSGMNQQFRPVPPSINLNQQFRQVPPSTNLNQQFGQPLPNTSTNQQFFTSQGNQPIRSPPLPVATASQPSPGPGGLNSNNDWLGGRSGVAPTGPASVLNSGASTSVPKSQDQPSILSLTATKNPKTLDGSGNGFASQSMFGGDVFSTIQSSSVQAPSTPTQPSSGMPTSSAIVPVTTVPQPPAKPDPFEVLQSNLTKPSTMGQPQQTSSVPKSNQLVSTQVTSFGSSSGAPSGVTQPQQTPSLPKSNQLVSTQATSFGSSSGVPSGVGNSDSEQSQITWPKMTRASIQKYAKVFVEVDTDRDGKITGEQARNLFMSWRLPIEVLKQVWDLSDQDSDSMLSLREFCVALYLMERYREGRPLPSSLPSSVMLDETLLSLAGPPAASYGSMGWGGTTGIRPQQLPPGAQPVAPAGLRPPTQTFYSSPGGSMQFSQQNATGHSVDNSYAREIGNVEENSLDNKVQEAESDEKVENKEKVILDSREKLEFYRTKMQDLVLYKSRCDNRLNDITERALADMREAELLAKKYEEKYKQVAEIASKLTIEEASFREIQERKMELQQAIIKMEHGGSADGILQVRADRIQSDLEELLKAVTERCKKHDLQIKSTALIELPAGWQPGIPEFALIWDEDWDKFEDEGFSFDVAAPSNGKSTSVHEESTSPTHNFFPDSVSNADSTSEKPFGKGVTALEENEPFYIHSEDESKSPQGSPSRQTAFESPSPKYSESHFRESPNGDAETHRSFDEPAWGTFDNNDDIDSVWGFNSKDSDHGKHDEKYFFGSNDFGARPGKSDSPQKNSPFMFENSVPGSPQSRAGNSPPRYSVESRDPFFDSFSRYDSFHTQDHASVASSPRRETFARFDSINSTRDFGHSGGYSFDDSDPFGSSGPFKVSSESETPKKGSDNWGSF